MPTEDLETTLTPNGTSGKRKRSESSEIATITRPAGGLSEEEKARRQRDAIEDVSKDLLAVLKEYDPSPSILSYSLSAIAGLESSSPPTKRTKLSKPIPDTIGERLAEATYPSINVFLSDVSSVCRALTASLSSMPRSNTAVAVTTANGSSSWENTNTTIARVIYFERLAKDLVNRQRKRLAEVLDLAEEVDMPEKAKTSSDKVALTVLTYSGPVFSSLPKPDNIIVPSTVSSRSTSASGSPKSPASTAATSVSDWPKAKTESLSVTTPFIEPAMPLPHITTVKAVPAPGNARQVPRAPRLGETFPPPPGLLHLQSPPVDFKKIGLKWGGEVGPGGVVIRPEVEYRTEITGHWLQYTNHPQPRLSRLPPDPYRQGIGLPQNFVAAYSSFAPTRDDSMAKVSAAVSNAMWWERRGGRIFRRIFGDDAVLGHMFREYEPTPRKPSTTAVVPVDTELDEKALEEMIESFEELPIDTRLLMDNDTKLAEISSLLSTLQSQQYQRLATLLGPNDPPPHQPASEEVKTYLRLRDRLAFLIESLPPHVLATIDGNPDSELIISKKIPVFTGGAPVFKGTLPSEDGKQPPQVQQAAMTAMNAAAGLSPISPAPIANMMGGPSRTPQQPQRVQGAPHITVGGPPPQPALPPQTPQQHYLQPYSPAPQGQYPQQQQQQQRMYQTPPQQQQQTYAQRPRGNVPPPQGLGAIGVGGGYGYSHTPRPQMGTPVAGGAGQERYTRSRR